MVVVPLIVTLPICELRPAAEREPRLKALLTVKFAAASVPPARIKTSDAPAVLEIVPLALTPPPPADMVTIVVLEFLVKDTSFTGWFVVPVFAELTPV